MKINEKLWQKAQQISINQNGCMSDDDIVMGYYKRLLADSNEKTKKTIIQLGIVIIFICVALLSINANASKLDFFKEKDKQYHITASALIASTTHIYTKDWKKSAIVCGAAGLGKEIYDEFDYGGFDMRDIKADVIGCVAGLALSGTILNGLTLDKDYVNYTVRF